MTALVWTRNWVWIVGLSITLGGAGCPGGDGDDASDDDDVTADDDDATAGDDDDATAGDDDDTTEGDDDDTTAGDDDDTSGVDPVDPPPFEDLGGYLAVLYTHMVLPIMDQEMADAGGRFYTYSMGTDPGTFETMEIDTCEYRGPGDNSTFGDLTFSGRTAGNVTLSLGGTSIPLLPGTGEDGEPNYQNGGLVVGTTHQFNAWYGIEATGADVPAFSIPAAIHTPPDAQPVTPPLLDGWTYTGGDWPFTWSGTSDGEIRLNLMYNEGLTGAHEILCRLLDDGEHTIPEDVLSNLGNSGYIRTGSMERIHKIYYPLPDGTVLETYGSNIYVFDWVVTL